MEMSRTTPEVHAVHYGVLRSLARAVYGPQPEGHYALASDCYCHFTSPIRRYPDLTVHRRLDALGRKRRPPADGLIELGEACSQLERRAEAAERELVKLKLLLYLSSRIGEVMEAVITGVEAFGIFVQGIELPAEGLVPRDSLPGDTYRYDRRRHMLAGHRAGNSFRLGDRVRVVVAKIDLQRRSAEFRLEERRTRSKKTPAEAASTKPSRKGNTTAKKPRKGKRYRRW